MIKLQDLIKEAEEGKIEKELKSAFNDLAKEIENIDPNDIQDIEESELNEAATVLVGISLLLSIPGLIKLISTIITRISKLLTRNKIEKTKITDWLINWAGKWENTYISIIKQALKRSGFAKKAGVDKDADLDKMAKITYFSILAVTALSAGAGSIESIIDGLNNSRKILSLRGIAAKEIYNGIKQLKDKIV